MRILPRRLNTRLILLVSCILLATGAASAWLTAKKQSDTLFKSMQESAAVMVSNLGENSARYLVLADYAGLEAFLMKAAELPDIQRLQVSEPDGTVVGDMERSVDGRIRAVPGLHRLVPPSLSSSLILVRGDSLIIWRPVVAGSVVGWIKATYDMAAIRRMQAETWRNSIVIAVLAMACSAVLLAFVLRPVVREIGRLALFARGLNRQKGEQRELGRQPDELRVLGVALNFASRELYSAEQELVRERERLRVTLQSIKDGVIATDAAGQVVLMNRASEDLTGWREADALGRNLGEVFPLITPGTGEQHSAALPSGRTAAEIAADSVLRAKTGALLPIAGSCAPIVDNLGAVGGLVIVFRDSAEQRRAEEALLRMTGELEQRVRERTAELSEKNSELERMNRIFVGRELRMAELKERIKTLGQGSGEGRS